jgi:hypothetical protein
MEYEEISKAVMKDDQIGKRKKNLTVAIILLVCGCICIIAGYLTKALPNLSFLCFAAGLILVIVGIIDLVMPSGDLEYKPAKEIVKKKEIYIAESNRAKMLDAIKDGDINALKGMAVDNSSPLKLVFFECKSGKFVAMQAQEFVPYQYEPFQETALFHDGKPYPLTTTE